MSSTTAELTPRQAEILDFIRRHAAETGMPPTRAEISAAFGFRSPNAAEGHLRALARKGVIELLPGASRGIRLCAEARPGNTLPVIGRVAAGSPILAQEYVEDELTLSPELFDPPADYLLRVRGMSMRDAGILDGDLLAVHTTQQARDGQVVVAHVGDEVTVKRLKRDGVRVILLPENPDFEPIEVDPLRDEFRIEGVAVGVIRRDRWL